MEMVIAYLVAYLTVTTPILVYLALCEKEE